MEGDHGVMGLVDDDGLISIHTLRMEGDTTLLL